MAKPTTPQEAIEQSALSPASVTNTDGQSVTDKRADDLLKLRDAEAAAGAKATDKLGLVFRQLVPPGMR